MVRFLHSQPEWKRKQNWNVAICSMRASYFGIVRVNLILPMIPYNYAHHSKSERNNLCVGHFDNIRWRVRLQFIRIKCDDSYTRRRSDAKRNSSFFFSSFRCLCSVKTTCFIAESSLAHNQYGTQTSIDVGTNFGWALAMAWLCVCVLSAACLCWIFLY